LKALDCDIYNSKGGWQTHSIEADPPLDGDACAKWVRGGNDHHKNTLKVASPRVGWGTATLKRCSGRDKFCISITSERYENVEDWWP